MCSKGMKEFKSDIQNFWYSLFFLDLYTSDFLIFVQKLLVDSGEKDSAIPSLLFGSNMS